MLTNSINFATVDVAMYKLQLHKQKGTKSELSILEVAKLMDVIHFQDKNQHSIFEQIGRISLN
jgi:hypothetical protein